MTTERPRILCVDDEPMLLAGLTDMLRKRFDVTTALGGEDGLRALRERGPFSVVVSDFAMPEMTGAQFLAQARIVAPDTVRMLLTGQASMADAIAAINDGNIFRFLAKPCPPSELIDALEAGVEQARLVTADRLLVERKLDAIANQLIRAERLASLGTMAGAVGHELNNALTVYASALELICDDARLGRVPAAEDLDALVHVRDQLAKHARNLLHLGRPPAEAGPRPSADVCGTVRAVVTMLQSAGILRHARLVLEIPQTTLPAIVQPPELEQVLVNLIKNAVDATPRDRAPEIAIVVRTAPDTASVVCTISDRGTGIPQASLSSIFEPYFTTKPPDRGTGLGLFVVRQIIERHGGRVAVESLEGHGTTFTLELPSGMPTSGSATDARVATAQPGTSRESGSRSSRTDRLSLRSIESTSASS